MRLTERDIKIICFINEFGFCEMTQIEKMFCLNKPRNYEIMRKLVKNGFVNHKRIYIGRHGIYFATKKGAKLTGLPAIDRISMGQYEHQINIVKTYVKLRKQYPNAHWISERRLKHDKFFDGIGKTGHISDGMLLFPDGKQIAIEVEISVKGKNRIEKILKSYGAQLSIKEVWYFCTPPVMSMLRKIVVKMPFIKVYSLEDLFAC